MNPKIDNQNAGKVGAESPFIKGDRQTFKRCHTSTSKAYIIAMSRRVWSKREDEELTSLVQHFGDRRGKDGKWAEISKRLPGRTNKVHPNETDL